MPIDSLHKDYTSWNKIWERTRDGIAGQDIIKKKRFQYLPQLNGQLTTDYDSYLKRAVYTNFAGRVLDMARGQLFRKDPVIDGIDDEILENIDLAGSSFNYFAERIADELMITNRIGILVDWDEVQARPYAITYKAESIINWQENIVNGIKTLVRIVLKGTIETFSADDPYKPEEVEIWKELYLDNVEFEDATTKEIIATPIYRTRDWRKRDKKFWEQADKFEIIAESTPMLNGAALDFIPFFMLTCQGVNAEIKSSPIKDMVIVNLAHYRNSADYENMIHWTGAKTVIAAGWDETKPFPIGGCVTGGPDFKASFLEARSDSALEEAMKRKEEQMSVLGSAMITGKGRYVASGETSKITAAGEHASLADIATSMSDGLTKVCGLMMQWLKNSESKVKIDFNTDYDTTELVYTDLVPLMGAVQSGFMSFDTFFYILKSKDAYPSDWTQEEELKAIAATSKAILDRREMMTPPELKQAQMQKGKLEAQGKQTPDNKQVPPPAAPDAVNNKQEKTNNAA